MITQMAQDSTSRDERFIKNSFIVAMPAESKTKD